MKHLIAKLSDDSFNVPKTELTSDSIATIFQIVFALAGAIALIILLVASLKYITSRGDPGAVAKAKNTILYAVIGLVVTATSFGIVGFIIGKV